MKGLSKINKGVAGVYKISINNHIYIGQSVNILNRLKQHQSELQRQEHRNPFLQNAYNKHKASKVKVQVLYKAKKELFNKEQLRAILTIVEQTFINYYKADLNLQPAYLSNLGNQTGNTISNFNGSIYHPIKGTIRIKNLGKYCRENGLDSTEMKKVTIGKVDHYKGYFYSQEVYQVYKDRALDYKPLEGIDLPLLTKDLGIINEIIEEITYKKDFYSENTFPWSNKELTRDLFITYIEKEYPDLVNSLLEGNRRISEYPQFPVCGFSYYKEPSSRNVFKNVLDVRLDISSYKDFYYPVGNPTVINEELDNALTLKEFLKTYKEELVDKLYVIYVKGNLKHKQDLVFSKYSNKDKNNSAPQLLKDNYEQDNSWGDFLLTSKQLELGIVTSDTLDILKKVCTSKEWQDWLNLGVTLAVFYPKSLELSLEEWANKHNSLSAVGTKTPREDNRSRYWCRFPLESFIGPLITMRKFYKSKREEHPSYESKQLLLKLIINTLYGDLASPHFPIGNTVLANNITSSVRNGSWIMSKALGCKFVVTDGGVYEFDSIPQFKTHLSSFRKPGLQTLFTKSRWKEFVSYISLSLDIPNLKEFILADKDRAAKHLDALATEVINNFCAIYGLEFPFSIEHKINNSAALCVTNPYGKVDYILYTFWDEEFIRIRGVKKQEYDIHPKVEALRALAEDRPARFHGAELIHIIGINEYIKNPNCFTPALPGHEQPVECIHKPNREGSYIFEDYATYHKAKDAHRKRVAAYDKKYKHVELLLKPSFL